MKMVEIKKLSNPIKEYSWGSQEAIPDLLSLKKDGKPRAELWMGTHPSAPSVVLNEDGTKETLDKLIAGNPEFFLGSGIAGEFSNTLPFLFKLLAVEKPLSIQAHPDRKRAKAGFDEEEKKKIPLDAGCRNYKDRNHKPELILALTPFYAMCGFRNYGDIVNDFSILDFTPLSGSLRALKTDPSEKYLREFFKKIMEPGDSEKKSLVNSLFRIKKKLSVEQGFWIERLNVEYPEDIGVVCPLLLNIVLLEPGEALFLSEGILHSYLQGFGVEIMANSDNVIRGGLTPKHVDVQELITMLKFSSHDVKKVIPEIESGCEKIYSVPVRDFLLSEIALSSNDIFKSRINHSFEILLCVKGRVEIFSGNDSISVSRGESVFIPFSVENYFIKGEGRIFKAGIP